MLSDNERRERRNFWLVISGLGVAAWAYFKTTRPVLRWLTPIVQRWFTR